MIELTKYPKSKELLKQDTLLALRKFMNEFNEGEHKLSEEFITQEVVESTLKATLENNIRSLFSFFDKQGIFLTIIFWDLEYWEYVINKDKSVVFFDTRELAEKAGIEECFKLLEQKL